MNFKDFKIEFLIDGRNVGSSYVSISNGELRTEAAEEEFYAVLRKNAKSLIQEVEDLERSEIIDNLTDDQETKLKDEHAKDYHGTDDDMPDAYEGWLENLSLDEMKQILK